KAVKDALVIAWINGWIAVVRGWVWVVASSVSPISFLVILTIYGGEQGLKWGLVGGFIWTMASNGISLIGDAVYYRLGIKYQSMLTAAPVSPPAYALGLALSSFIFATPTLAVYLAAMAIFGVQLLNLQTLYAMAALWLASTGLGFTLSGFIQHMRYAWALPQILSAVFTVGAPVYYPAHVLPSPYLGVVLPTGAAAMLIQDATNLTIYDSQLLTAAALALAVHSAVGLFFLAKLAQWRQP
ncbi:MAG: ABC transporter permease, partial [Pyrobaculum sp.]